MYCLRGSAPLASTANKLQPHDPFRTEDHEWWVGQFSLRPERFKCGIRVQAGAVAVVKLWQTWTTDLLLPLNDPFDIHRQIPDGAQGFNCMQKCHQWSLGVASSSRYNALASVWMIPYFCIKGRRSPRLVVNRLHVVHAIHEQGLWFAHIPFGVDNRMGFPSVIFDVGIVLCQPLTKNIGCLPHAHILRRD